MDVTDAVLHVGQVCSEGGSPPFPAATPRGVPAPCCPAPNNTSTSGWVKSNTPTPTASFPADITDLCVCVLGVNVSFCYQHSPEQSRQRTEADIFWGILWVVGFWLDGSRLSLIHCSIRDGMTNKTMNERDRNNFSIQFYLCHENQ